MKWLLKDKEEKIFKRFALFPKRVQKYRIWLEHYYVVYDYVYDGIYSEYQPNYFVNYRGAVHHIIARNKHM